MASNFNIRQTSKSRIGSRNLQTSSSEAAPTGRGKKSFRSRESSLSPTTSGSIRRSENVKPKIRFDSKSNTRNSSISKNSPVLRKKATPRCDTINDSGMVESDKPIRCKRALCPPTCRSRTSIPKSETSILSGTPCSYRSSCSASRVIRNSQEEFPIDSSVATNVSRTHGINRSYESNGFPGGCGAMPDCRNSQTLTNIDARRSYVGPHFSNEILSERRSNDVSTNTASLPVIIHSVSQVPRSHNPGMCPCRLGPDGRKSSRALGIASGPASTRTLQGESLYGGNTYGAIQMLGAASVLVHRQMLAHSVPSPGFNSPSITGFGAPRRATGNSTRQGLINTSVYNPRREAPPIYREIGNDNSTEDSRTNVDEHMSENKIKKNNKMENESDILTPILPLDNTPLNKPITRSETPLSVYHKSPNNGEETPFVSDPEVETMEDENISETFDEDTQVQNTPDVPDFNKKNKKKKKEPDILSPILSLDNITLNTPTRRHEEPVSVSHKTPISGEKPVVSKLEFETLEDANIAETLDGVNKNDTQIQNTPDFPVESNVKKNIKKKKESNTLSPKLSLDNSILNETIADHKTSISISHKSPITGEIPVVEPEVQTKDGANVVETLDDDTEVKNTSKFLDVNEFSNDIEPSGNTQTYIEKSPEYPEEPKSFEDPVIKPRCPEMRICADIPGSSCVSRTNGLFVFAELSQSPTTSKTTGKLIVSAQHISNGRSEFCSNRGIENVCPETEICKVPKPKRPFHKSKYGVSRILGERRDTESSRSITMPNSLEIQGDETLDRSQTRRENVSSIISDDTRNEQKRTETSEKDNMSKVTKNLQKAETQSACETKRLTVIIQGSGNARVSVTSGSSEILQTLRDKDVFVRACASGMPRLPEDSATVGSSRRNADICERNRCVRIPELSGKPSKLKPHELNESRIPVSSQAASSHNNIELSDVSRLHEIEGYADKNNTLSMSETARLSRYDKMSIGVARGRQVKKGSGKWTTINAIPGKPIEECEKCAPGGIYETVKTVCDTKRMRSHGLELKAGGRNQTCTGSRAVETLTDTSAYEQSSRQGRRYQTNKKRSFKTPSPALRRTARHCGNAIISGGCNPQTNFRVGNAFGMLEAAGNARYGTCFEDVARQLIATRHRSQKATRRRPNTPGIRTQCNKAEFANRQETAWTPSLRVVAHTESSISSEIMYQYLNSDSD